MKAITKPKVGDYIQHRQTGDFFRITKVTKHLIEAKPTIVKVTFNGKPDYRTNSYSFIART